MSRSRPLVIVALAVVAIGIAGAMGALMLDSAQAAVGPLPAEGLVLPAEAKFVAGVDVQRLIESPHYKKLVERKQNKRLEALQDLEDATGLVPERDVEQVVFAGAGDQSSASGAVLVLGKFDRERLGAALTQKVGVTEKKQDGITLYLLPEFLQKGDPSTNHGQPTLAFLDDRTVALGTLDAVEAIAGVRAEGRSPLRDNAQMIELLQQVRPGSTFWLVGDRTLLADLPKALPGGANSPVNLPALQSLIVTADIDPAFSIHLVGEARDAKAANNLADVVRGISALAALQAGQRPELQELASAISVTTDDKRVQINARFTWELIEGIAEAFEDLGSDHGSSPSEDAEAGDPAA